jgi:hypothetical protein
VEVDRDRALKMRLPADSAKGHIEYDHSTGHGTDQRRGVMTTSRETDWMNHPVLRRLVTDANALTLAERITLVKGLVPGIADQLSEREYEGFIADIRIKGERFHEAKSHPGEGRAERKTLGERDLEGRGDR